MGDEGGTGSGDTPSPGRHRSNPAGAFFAILLATELIIMAYFLYFPQGGQVAYQSTAGFQMLVMLSIPITGFLLVAVNHHGKPKASGPK